MKARSIVPTLVLIASVSASSRAAEASNVVDAPATDESGSSGDHPRGVGLEVNVLWPFLGISEFRVMIPVVRTDRRDFRGELVLGVYADFANRLVRDDTYGKVATLAAKIGWRQFFVYGLHVEAAFNAGWRHESQRPPENLTIDGFATRLWIMAGYQHEFSPLLYANVRGGVGLNVYRSDAYASLEKFLTGGADVNIGVRF